MSDERRYRFSISLPVAQWDGNGREDLRHSLPRSDRSRKSHTSIGSFEAIVESMREAEATNPARASLPIFQFPSRSEMVVQQVMTEPPRRAPSTTRPEPTLQMNRSLRRAATAASSRRRSRSVVQIQPQETEVPAPEGRFRRLKNLLKRARPKKPKRMIKNGNHWAIIFLLILFCITAIICTFVTTAYLTIRYLLGVYSPTFRVLCPYSLHWHSLHGIRLRHPIAHQSRSNTTSQSRNDRRWSPSRRSNSRRL
jgi:hypothetical protein